MYQYIYTPITKETTEEISGGASHDGSSSSSSSSSPSPDAKRFKETRQDEDALALAHVEALADMTTTTATTTTTTTTMPPPPPPLTEITSTTSTNISTSLATTAATTTATTIATTATTTTAVTPTVALQEVDVGIGMLIPPSGMLIVSPIQDNATLDTVNLLRAYDAYKNSRTTAMTTTAAVTGSREGHMEVNNGACHDPSSSSHPHVHILDAHLSTAPNINSPMLGVPIVGVYDDYVIINEAYSIRDVDDSFGRQMTDLRKSFTQDDRMPFETTK